MDNKIYNSDKHSTGLFLEYEKIFQPFRNDPINYLEIGIAAGGSLEWARDYFKQGSKIQGIDLKIPRDIEGVEMYCIDQKDKVGLKSFGIGNGLFDVIIDDGAHTKDLSENTFNSLYPYLKTNGIYIIEDWGAGYFPLNPHCKGLENLVTDLVWKYGGYVSRPKTGGSYALINKI
jgi:hypothetical protein